MEYNIGKKYSKEQGALGNDIKEDSSKFYIAQTYNKNINDRMI